MLEGEGENCREKEFLKGWGFPCKKILIKMIRDSN